jgi:hypothetical protein
MTITRLFGYLGSGTFGHSIDDVVDTDAIRERYSAFGILGAVDPFPSFRVLHRIKELEKRANFSITSPDDTVVEKAMQPYSVNLSHIVADRFPRGGLSTI